MGRLGRAILLPVLGCCALGCSRGRVTDVGPRRVSNQTAYPVIVYGEKLARGSSIRLGAPASRTLPTAFIDQRHLAAVIPEGLAADQPKSEREVELEVLAPDGKPIPGQAKLTIVDDIGFPTPYAMAVSGDGARIFVVSRSTDELWVYPRKEGVKAERVRVGDGPRALAIIPASAAPGGEELLAVADEFAPELRLVKTGDPSAPQRIVAIRVGAQDVAVDAELKRLYVSNHVTDKVEVIDLAREKVIDQLSAGVNPRWLAIAGDQLAVGEIGADTLALIDPKTSTFRRSAPRPLIPMSGARGENGSPFVLGGTSVRALAWSPSTKRLLVASLGPNVGPNPLDMEAPSDGGVAVVDETGKFLRHVSIRGGPAQAIALDDARGWLYAADIGQGVIVALDVHKMVESDASAKSAARAGFSLPVPTGVDLIRPASDFGVRGRPSASLHFGPSALALTDGGKTLLVLSKYTAQIAELDTSAAPQLTLRKVIPGPNLGRQRERRRGEEVYFSDLGNTGRTCDGCHLDGHTDGILFEKGRPRRIYRVSTLRSIAESPPYFFPQTLASLEATSVVVLARNRLHNPDATPTEVSSLSLYQRAITALPNPYLAPDGSLPETITLPDGRTGHPARGLALFDGAAGCADASCHPPPHFTCDQSPAKRGLSHFVGTPAALLLRPELQEAKAGELLAVPSLIGAWDTFPLLASGAGGLEVTQDGQVEPKYPFALRRVLEYPGTAPHGNTSGLTAEQKDDLLAYLLTL